MMTSKSDIEHWHITAKVYKDRVEEIHYITDPARNIRRKPQTEVWQVKQFLGRGGFGAVRLEENKEDSKKRAVKRIQTTTTSLSNSHFKKELKALLEFSKPKSKEAAVFVDFFGWFEDGSDIFLAMEYIPLGDLERNVVKHSGKIPEHEARDITEQILTGLEIMHAESFAHRDLKPQNILVVNGPPRWWVKLADFGLSKKLTETTAYRTMTGTPHYIAPEILNYVDTDAPSSEYTNAIDVWAVGCITYRLVTGTVPFPQLPSLVRYCADRSRFPHVPLFNSGITRAGSEFIQKLLVIQPEERPSASQALSHTWITSGSDTARGTDDLLQPNQETSGLSEPTISISTVDYNTPTHNGLKSSRLPSSSLANPSYTESSPQPHTASDSNKTDSKMRRSPVTIPSGKSQANATSSNDHRAETALYSAASHGHVELVEFLLEKGADHKFTSANGWTPLNAAANNGHLEVVKALLAKGADITIANNDGWTPLNTAASNGYLEIVKALLAKGADLTIPTNDKQTPLYSAACEGYVELVEFLLENGADHKITNVSGWTPLNAAANQGHLEVVKALLAKGADITIANNDGWTPLNAAASNGHLEIVKVLL